MAVDLKETYLALLSDRERSWWHDFVESLPDRVEPHDQFQLGYFFALLGALASTLILLVIYVGILLVILLGAVGAWCWVAGVWEFSGISENWRGKWGAVLALFATIICASLFSLLTQRTSGSGRGDDAGVTLDPMDHPLFWSFLAHIAALSGAPVPRRVTVDCSVNASANFDDARRRFFPRATRLHLGLPLIAGLSVRGFAGILAHELGHFSQTHGMRLSVVIRRVNHFFACRLQGEGSIRERLWHEARSGRWWRSLSAWFLLVTLAPIHWILRCFLALSQGALAMALRQMEFDADRFEVAWAGSEQFERTNFRIVQLTAGFANAWEMVRENWRERRLVDDFPELALARADRLDLDLESVFWAQKLSGYTKNGFFLTHPSDTRRSRNARKFARDGIVAKSGAASILFRDFRGLSLAVTRRFYEREFGQVATMGVLESRAEVEREDRRRQKERWAIEAAWGPHWRGLPRLHFRWADLAREVAMPPRCREMEEDPGAEILSECAREYQRCVQDEMMAVADYERAVVGGAVRRGSGIPRKVWRDPWRMQERKSQAELARQKLEIDLAPPLRFRREFLVESLATAARSGSAFFVQEIERFARVMDFFSQIQKVWSDLEYLLEAQNALAALIDEEPRNEEALRRLREHGLRLHRILERLSQAGESTDHPFVVADSRPLRMSAVFPDWDDSVAEPGLRALVLANQMQRFLWKLYERTCGRLLILAAGGDRK